jgi:hypothetical protein
MITLPVNSQLIVTGGKLVLIDCGNGVAAFEAAKGAVGRVAKNLSPRPASTPRGPTPLD